MSDDHANSDAQREAARRRLRERQARHEQEAASAHHRLPHLPHPDDNGEGHAAAPRPHAGASHPAAARPANGRPAAPHAPRVQRTDARRGTPHPAGTHPTGARPAVDRPSAKAQAHPHQAAAKPHAAGSAGKTGNAGKPALDQVKGVAGSIGGAAARSFDGLAGRVGERNARIGLIAVAIALLVVIGILVHRCTTPPDPGQEALNTAQQQVSSSSFSNDDGTKPDQKTLTDLLGTETATALLNAASSNEEVYWIASHPDSYTVDGDAVQVKLLTLAANEPAAVGFVRNWPDSYPQTDVQDTDPATPSAESSTSVPVFYQWDTRWGYTVYSSTTFALTGCCPTALAMVYQGVTGNTDKSPYDMAQLAHDNGYETEYDGTDETMLTAMAPDFGMECTKLDPAATNLTQTLEAGQVLIINVGPGDFTTSGHFIVAAGLTDDGKVIVNDPYSAVHTNETWDVDTLVGQAKAFYAFSAA